MLDENLLASRENDDETEHRDNSSSASTSTNIINNENSNDDDARSTFNSRTEYILTMIGYTVGLGNVWRWPFQCFSNGGAAFLIVYVIVLVAVAMPVFLLEVAVGQRFRSTPVPIWSAIHPALCGLGWAATLSSWVTAWYYNVIDAWSLFYLGASLFDTSPSRSGADALHGAGLPWADHDCSDDNFDDSSERTCGMNATVYWERVVLRETDNVNHLGALNWPLAGCLLLAWIIVFGVLCKGVESAGKVVVFTATFPYVVLVVLLVRGLTLDGAGVGLRVLFVPDMSKIGDWRVWYAALNQVTYGLGLSTGSLVVFGSFNPPSNDVVKDTLLLPMINLLTNVLGATVVFSVAGYVAHTMGNDTLDDLDLSGGALAFMTYSTALASMPGGLLLAPFFFLMLLCLGLDSCFALVELVITTLIDTRLSPFSHPGKKSNWRLSLTVVLCTFLPGLVFVARGGIFILNIVDAYSVGPVLMVIAAAECIGIAWVYGSDRFMKESFALQYGDGGEGYECADEEGGLESPPGISQESTCEQHHWGGSSSSENPHDDDSKTDGMNVEETNQMVEEPQQEERLVIGSRGVGEGHMNSQVQPPGTPVRPSLPSYSLSPLRRRCYVAYWRFCIFQWTWLAPLALLVIAVVGATDALMTTARLANTDDDSSSKDDDGTDDGTDDSTDLAALVCAHSWDCPLQHMEWAVAFGFGVAAATVACLPFGGCYAIFGGFANPPRSRADSAPAENNNKRRRRGLPSDVENGAREESGGGSVTNGSGNGEGAGEVEAAALEEEEEEEEEGGWRRRSEVRVGYRISDEGHLSEWRPSGSDSISVHVTRGRHLARQSKKHRRATERATPSHGTPSHGATGTEPKSGGSVVVATGEVLGPTFVSSSSPGTVSVLLDIDTSSGSESSVPPRYNSSLGEWYDMEPPPRRSSLSIMR